MNPEGTVEPERAPSSRASEELAQLEAALGLPPDAKLNLTTEEDGESHLPLPHICLIFPISSASSSSYHLPRLPHIICLIFLIYNLHIGPSQSSS